MKLLDQWQIQQHLKHKQLDICLFESVPSTNDYLKKFKGNETLKFCLAEQQTQGRGRLNRTWHSPFGQNLYLSCLYSFHKEVSELAGLSLVISLAIIKTLKQFNLHEHIFVKWPNDIIYIENAKNKKLSGCLIDIYADTQDKSHAVIGIGINVNMLHDKEEINQPWTSMQKILGKVVDRNVLCAGMIDNLLDYLAQFTANGFSFFISEWMKSDYLLNQVVELHNLNQKIIGKVVGVNAQGQLLLQLATDEICANSSGEAMIVK